VVPVCRNTTVSVHESLALSSPGKIRSASPSALRGTIPANAFGAGASSSALRSASRPPSVATIRMVWLSMVRNAPVRNGRVSSVLTANAVDRISPRRTEPGGRTPAPWGGSGSAGKSAAGMPARSNLVVPAVIVAPVPLDWICA
jgi:hypothetical protein